VQVSFIIPVFNQLAHTRACLESLKASLWPTLTHEIILIDDGSTDGTRQFLSELPPPVIVLLNERNLGYAASNNRAARIAQGEFLALLNNDLVLTPGWLQPMLEAFRARPNAGVVGNLQLDASNDAVDHAGVVFRQGGYPLHLRETVAEAQARGPHPVVPAVTAACCLVRREWFVRAGGFDEGYRNGFEDSDLCLRAREDGLVNVVATASVVRHHISQSEGRSAFEYRNAERFLARWGERTAALEREWDFAEARDRAAAAAQQYFAPWHRRLGFGARTLRAQHTNALIAARRGRVAATRPIRIGVDLLRMAPGGANGGIKPFVYSYLAEIGRQRGAAFNLAVFAPPALRDELAAVLRPGDYVLEPGETSVGVLKREPAAWKPAGHFAATDPIARRAQLDALYAPFGVSRFMAPDLPCVSLIVDVLHRELPAALPIEEVNHRHRWFEQVAREATYIQCNSHYVTERVTAAYSVPPARCFRVYNVVQNRLAATPNDVLPPPGTPESPFFFYPANFWPHKNHEALLVAYRLYVQGAGSRAWPLVFTGQPDARMKLLEEMRDGLALTERVRFLGHVDDAAFAAIWSRAGALVFPSLHEGFGIPLLEAMRFGVPIIAAQASSLPEVGGDACLYVDPADPAAMAESLRRIAIRENLREDLVARGRVRLGAFDLKLEAGRLAHFLDCAARRLTP
jgi:GT2 family glycosyltransferase/glycosyltransferase involved in cell wall biosynthesis